MHQAFLLGCLSSPLSLSSWARSSQAALPPSHVERRLQKALGFCVNLLLPSGSGSCRKRRRPNPGQVWDSGPTVAPEQALNPWHVQPRARAACAQVTPSTASWPVKKAQQARVWVTFGLEQSGETQSQRKYPRCIQTNCLLLFFANRTN